MTVSRLRSAAAVAAVLVITACGGGDGDSGNDSADGGASGDDTTQTEGSNECVGKDGGSIELTEDGESDLPGGSSASLDSTDFDAQPPTASLALGDATQVERKNAKNLTVGDQFGLQRAVYKVVTICPDSVALDEF